MTSASAEARREHNRRYYKKNKEKYAERRRAQRQEVTDYINSLKEEAVCECGEDHPACLVFHHVGEKHFHVSQAARLGYSLKKVKEEVDKCVILCSNCHRKHHWNEKLKV